MLVWPISPSVRTWALSKMTLPRPFSAVLYINARRIVSDATRERIGTVRRAVRQLNAASARVEESLQVS